jgi:diguanylate cyclase (GGDEF)-like protein
MSVSNISKFDELKATGLLPSPKGVALAVMELAQDENTTNAAMTRTIQADPALSGRIVKAANTAQFAGRRPVASIADAVVVLGLSAVRQMALGFSLVSDYRDGKCAGFDYPGFWSRSLVTALAMQAITRHTRVAIPEEMFLLGLLSRIGCLALATVYPQDYTEVLHEHANGAIVSLSPLERRRFATDHNELTVALMSEWGMPKVLVEPVLHHEHPVTGKFAEGARAFSLCHGLHLAGYFSDLCLAPEAARPAMLPNLFLLGAGIALDAERVSEIAERSVRDWQEWGRLLEVPAGNVSPIAEMSRVTEKRTGDAAQGSNGAADSKQKLRLMVVDDDPKTRDFLNNVLGDAGYAVFSAVNGKQALEKALECRPQLIVVDWKMPEMDGLQFCRALRSATVGRGVYVVMLTGNADEGAVIEAFEAGVDDHVTKPINPKILLARLRAGERVVSLQNEIESDREEVRRFAAELAMTNRRLEEVALLDPLTGVPNRRYAMDRIEQEWAAAQRGARPLACMLIDIDHFKRVNDTHGHDVGDLVLQRVADVLKHTARTHDVVCRIGGEEFLMVCPDSDAVAAGQCAERLRQAVASMCVQVGNVAIKATISVGVAAMDTAMRGPEAMIKAADQALYAAKQAGRNRAWVHPSRPLSPARTAAAKA